jgi:hypothetical protein
VNGSKNAGVRVRLGVLAALAILAACDSGGVAAPEADDASLDDALALVTADAVLEDLDAMNDMMAPTVPAVAGGQGSAPGAMGSRSHLVRERTVVFYDAGGAEQEAYDALLTASIHLTLSLSGDIERGAMSASMSRSRDLWVTGLEGEETTRTFNGTGEESHDRTRVTDARGTRTFSMEAQAVIEDVVRAVDREAQPWPLSGTITREWTVVIGSDAGGEVTRNRTVTITFDGTRYALMTVDGETFEVDLAAGPADRPTRRRAP